MKRLILLLLLTSNLLFSQNNNVALFHAEDYPVRANSEEVVMAITSFELAGGLVVVRASVNGEAGDFVLDTGAPGVVLNSKKRTPDKSIEAVGVGGQLDVGEVELSLFNWGMIHKEDFTGLTLDISHLEKACERELMGLIGFEVLQNYEILFDHRNRVIRMYSADKAMDFRPSVHAEVVPFRFHGHVPVIAAKVGDKQANLAIDSGAEVNLLDDSFYRKLKRKHLKKVKKEMVTGLGNTSQDALSAGLDALEIEGVEVDDMRFLFLDLSPVQSQEGAKLDGLLGYPFFKEHTISINYQYQEIYIWE